MLVFSAGLDEIIGQKAAVYVKGRAMFLLVYGQQSLVLLLRSKVLIVKRVGRGIRAMLLD